MRPDELGRLDLQGWLLRPSSPRESQSARWVRGAGALGIASSYGGTPCELTVAG